MRIRPPVTTQDYSRCGLRWFNYFDENATALSGSAKLAGMKSLATMLKQKRKAPLAHNVKITPEHIVELRRKLKTGEVRERTF